MATREKLRLGDVLIRAGAITEEKLMHALSVQKETKQQLGKILVDNHFITEEKLLTSLSEQLSLPYIDLHEIKIDQKALSKVKESLAKRHKLIPIAIKNDRLVLAMSNPLNLFAIDEVTILTGMDVDLTIASEADIDRAIDDYFGVAASIQAAMKSINVDDPRKNQGKAAQGANTPVVTNINEPGVDAPVANLVEMVLKQAIEDRASDIHIEPAENELQIRYRIDGVLFDSTHPPKSVESALISRIKVMANMDIAETRAPQDGGFSTVISDRTVEFRVSSCPTIWGENLVLRILDRDKLSLKLQDLGLMGEGLEKFESMVKNPYGVILVTGPTGSGKTTTLYAALSMLNSSEKNIKTIEDPVEYRLEGIRQTQVNPKANIDFVSGLRSLMRQDPDIIMVGEIRDRETSEIAIQAALTGHLVFSTLHTNDAAGALSRLGDLGVEPFLQSSAITGVLAQRLARKICEHCKQERQASLDEMGALYPDDFMQTPVTLFYGEGCRACKKSGYSGRIGLFEILMIDDDIRQMILDGKAPMAIRDKAVLTQNMATLRRDGVDKVLKGFTTLDELNRVTVAEKKAKKRKVEASPKLEAHFSKETSTPEIEDSDEMEPELGESQSAGMNPAVDDSRIESPTMAEHTTDTKEEPETNIEIELLEDAPMQDEEIESGKTNYKKSIDEEDISNLVME